MDTNTIASRIRMSNPQKEKRTQKRCRQPVNKEFAFPTCSMACAPRGYQKDVVRSTSTEERSDPRTHSVLSPTKLQINEKKSESPLDFPLTRCKLMFGSGLRPNGN